MEVVLEVVFFLDFYEFVPLDDHGFKIGSLLMVLAYFLVEGRSTERVDAAPIIDIVKCRLIFFLNFGIYVDELAFSRYGRRFHWLRYFRTIRGSDLIFIVVLCCSAQRSLILLAHSIFGNINLPTRKFIHNKTNIISIHQQ